MEKETHDIYLDLANDLKKYLLENYEPVTSPLNADLHLSTLEIHNQLQKLLPAEIYSPADVAAWLYSSGFKFCDYGFMQFEWMLKTKMVQN